MMPKVIVSRKVIKPHGSSLENGGVDDPTLWIASDYSRDPQGNVMAVYESKFANSAHEYDLKERNIYGIARLGVDLNEVDMYLTPQSIISQSNDPQLKKYELTNHLGNVVATVNNYKIAVPDISGTLIDHYASDVANTSDYYPFGSLLKERTCRWVWMKGDTYQSDPTDVELAFVNMNEPPAGIAIEGKSYRFAFNGKEKDNEISGYGNQYDYGFRIYNSNLARFLSIDPLFKSYPWYTPFQFAGNNPIKFIDLDGLEEHDPSNDPMILSKLAKTTYFEVKHSAENLVLGIFVPTSDPAMKWQASYKVVDGNEIFETEITQVPRGGVLEEIASKVLDLINVVGAGKLDPSDVLAVKTNSRTQITREARRYIGDKGPKFPSIPLLRFKGSKARIEVENPSPGQRDGQIHYQDEKNVKYMYDMKQNKFFSKNKETGNFDVEAPRKVNELLENKQVQKAIEKGKEKLGETGD